MDKLELYRNQIDEIDKKILKLIAERFEVVKKVWKYKKENSMPALQKNRWNQVLDNRLELARKLSLDENMIKDIWNRIHEQALDNENKILG